MGHEEVYVLNGGLQEWVRQGFETIKEQKLEVARGNFKAQLNPDFIISKKEVEENLKSQKAQVIDARSTLRFNGEAPEPRAGLRSGHIPDSNNLHYANILEDGKYKSEEQLQSLFSEVTPNNQPLIFTCGSGITACILYLAADALLANNLSVYDGSWTEWGST